jgi:hypothetical protein
MLDPSSRASKVEFSEMESDSDVDSDFEEEGGRLISGIKSRLQVNNQPPIHNAILQCISL